jgi:hypothetical protein
MQMPWEAAGWFQGTSDAVKKFIWVLEVIIILFLHIFDFVGSMFLNYNCRTLEVVETTLHVIDFFFACLLGFV